MKEGIKQLARQYHCAFLAEIYERPLTNSELCKINKCQNAWGIKVLRDLMKEGLVEAMQRGKRDNQKMKPYGLTNKGERVAFAVRIAAEEYVE